MTDRMTYLERMEWQNKWLRRLRLPLILGLVASTLPLLYFPEWRYSATILFGAIILAYLVAFPFLTTGWPWRELREQEEVEP